MVTLEASERFRRAVKVLIDDPGDIKERLIVAYVSQLHEIDPERDLPPQLRETFQQLVIRLTQDEAAGDTGNVGRTIHRLNADQVRDVACQIFSLHLALSNAQGTAKQAKGGS